MAKISLKDLVKKKYRIYDGMKVDGLLVRIVDGKKVRDTKNIDFTEGDNDLHSPKIMPKNTIWLDDTNKPEHQAILIHEIVERNHEAKGMLYDKAHVEANKVEKKFRSKSM